MPKTIWFILIILLVPLIGFLVYVNSPSEPPQSTDSSIFPRQPAAAPKLVAPTRIVPAPTKVSSPASSLQFVRAAPEMKAKPAAKTTQSSAKAKKKKSKKRPAPSTASQATAPPRPKLQLQTN